MHHVRAPRRARGTNLRISTLTLRLSASIGALCLVSHASAQSASASAEVLFREGARLLKAGETAAACSKLEASYTLDPALGTLGMLAYCHERQQRLATAWQEYLRAAAEARAAKQPEREAVAQERASSLEQRVSHLTIRLTSGALTPRVWLNERELLPAELGVELPHDGGQLRIEAQREGHETFRTTLTLANEQGRAVIELPRLEPLITPPSSPHTMTAPVAKPPAASTAELEAQRNPWLIGGAASVAIAGVGVGSFFGVRALSKSNASRSECDGNACSPNGVALRDQALSAARVSTIGFVAAGVGAAAAVVFYTVPYFRQRSVRLSAGSVRGAPGLIITGQLQ